MASRSAKTCAARASAGADPDVALAAAEELGDIAGDVRTFKWMVGVLMTLYVAGTAAMVVMLFPNCGASSLTAVRWRAGTCSRR